MRRIFKNRTVALAGVAAIALIELGRIDFAPLVGVKAAPVVHTLVLVLLALLSAVSRSPVLGGNVESIRETSLGSK